MILAGVFPITPGGANARFVGPADANKVGLWTITGNHISSQGVNIHLQGCRGVVLTGNSLALGRERNILVEGGRHVVIGPHSLDRNPDYKGGTAGGVTLRGCDSCSLPGVLVEGSSAGSRKAGGAIELFDCREASVLACSVFEPKFRGVYVTGSRNTHVANCTIVDRTKSATRAAAIEVERSSGTVIRGNVFTKSGVIVAPGAVVEGNHAAAS